jgi:hypothetical protein
MVTALSGTNLLETVSRKAHIYSAFIRDPGRREARPRGRCLRPKEGWGLQSHTALGRLLSQAISWNRHRPPLDIRSSSKPDLRVCPIAWRRRGNLQKLRRSNRTRSITNVGIKAARPQVTMRHRCHSSKISISRPVILVSPHLCFIYASPFTHMSPHLCGGLLSILI